MSTNGSGSFWPWVVLAGSFRPIFGVGRFGLGRWVISALGRFGPRVISAQFQYGRVYKHGLIFLGGLK